MINKKSSWSITFNKFGDNVIQKKYVYLRIFAYVHHGASSSMVVIEMIQYGMICEKNGSTSLNVLVNSLTIEVKREVVRSVDEYGFQG